MSSVNWNLTIKTLDQRQLSYCYFEHYRLTALVILSPNLTIYNYLLGKCLTLYPPMLTSYRNQSIDLQNKSTDWFLFDGNISCRCVKRVFLSERFCRVSERFPKMICLPIYRSIGSSLVLLPKTEKLLTIFDKTPHLRCLTWLWIHLWITHNLSRF